VGTKKQDLYPPRYFKAANFPDTPMVLQIEVARREKMQNGGEEKVVVYFIGQKPGLILNPTMWDQIADVMVADGVSKYDSDDYLKWPNHWIELYRDDSVQYQGRAVGGIRVRRPGSPPPTKKKAKPKSVKPDFDDSINV
jgi:hypothetical protein